LFAIAFYLLRRVKNLNGAPGFLSILFPAKPPMVVRAIRRFHGPTATRCR
jgi:hypothetical protein